MNRTVKAKYLTGITGLCVLAGYLAICAFWFAPVLSAPGGRVIGHPYSDIWKHVWTHWHLRTRLAEGSFGPDFTPYLNAPDGGYLFDVNILNGILGLVLFLDHDLLLTANFVLACQLLLSAFAAWLLARELTGSPTAAFFAGAAYGFSPFLLGLAAASGVHERAAAAVIPLLLYLLLRICRHGGWGNKIGLAVTCGLAPFACTYYAIFAAVAGCLLLGCLLLSDLLLRRKARIRIAIRRLLPAFLLALVGMAPFIISFRGMHSARNLTPKRLRPYQTRPITTIDRRPIPEYFIPTRQSRIPVLQQDLIFKVPYLGWSLLLLAGAGILIDGRKRRINLCACSTAVIILLLSFGPQPLWNFATDHTNPTPLTAFLLRLLGTPARLAVRIVPFYHIISGIWELVLVALLGFAVAAAGALSSIRSPRFRTAVILLAVVLLQAETALWSGLPFPLPCAEIEVPTVYSTITAADHRTAVLDLPLFRNHSRLVPGEYYYYQTRHRQPIPCAINPITAACNPLYRYTAPHAPCRHPIPRRQALADFLTAVHEQNIAWIVLHERFLPANRLPRETVLQDLAETFGNPYATDRHTYLYRVTEETDSN